MNPFSFFSENIYGFDELLSKPSKIELIDKAAHSKVNIVSPIGKDHNE